MTGCYCAADLLVLVPQNEKNVVGYAIRAWFPEMPQLNKKVEIDFDNPATRVIRLEKHGEEFRHEPCCGAGKASVLVTGCERSRALEPSRFYGTFARAREKKGKIKRPRKKRN